MVSLISLELNEFSQREPICLIFGEEWKVLRKPKNLNLNVKNNDKKNEIEMSNLN